MNKSRGFTLVEMLATISSASVLLVLATGVLHRTMRFDSTCRQRAQVHRVAVRLSHDFRHDVHRAESFQVSGVAEEPSSILLELPDGGNVTYQVTEQRVLREQPLASQQVARQTYDFPDDYKVSFLRAGPRLAELTVEHDPHLIGVEPQTVVHVQAEVGRLLRLANVQEVSP